MTLHDTQKTMALSHRIAAFDGPQPYGRLVRLIGPVARTNLTDLRVGDLVRIEKATRDPLLAEVAGFDNNECLLNILGSTDGIDLKVRVVSTGGPHSVPVGAGLCGRVIDALGNPVDGHGPIVAFKTVPARAMPPAAMSRPLVDQVMSTGLRSIDGLLTLGAGQRVGVFGSPGAGKSTLLAQIAAQTNADVCVLCLVGERGREVREFLDRALPKKLRAKTAVVVETSDKPAGLRMMAGHTAMAVAEYFRDQGQNVLFMFDSVTRFARALREVGTALGLPPTRGGFTANVFEELPKLFERAGRTEAGTITGIFTTLSEGDGTDDPIVEEVQSLLDGHIHLSEALASGGHYPAIDILRSKSRLMNELVPEGQIGSANAVRTALASLEEVSFLLKVGEYVAGSDARVDAAIAAKDAINAFLRQAPDDISTMDQTQCKLGGLL